MDRKRIALQSDFYAQVLQSAQFIMRSRVHFSLRIAVRRADYAMQPFLYWAKAVNFTKGTGETK